MRSHKRQLDRDDSSFNKILEVLSDAGIALLRVDAGIFDARIATSLYIADNGLPQAVSRIAISTLLVANIVVVRVAFIVVLVGARAAHVHII